MGSIAILDENTINKIAAGEVVDRPASIVKELVENSIDAGATHIMIEIKNGGISYIRISDNGKGIEKDDVELAFERHATSKIRKEEDILNISSLGFRGEALASVAAISKVTLETKVKDEPTGTKIIIEGGKTLSIEEIAFNKGTTITIENVFYNVPARFKFLKKDYTEAGYIEDVVTRLAMIHPEISFKYICNNKCIIQTTGNFDIKQVIYNIFGKEVASELINVDYSFQNIKVKGVIGTPKISRSTRQNEFTYINGRYVKDKIMTSAIEKAFEQNLNIGKFPFAILDVTLPPNEVDVNVHPAKLEVKFENEASIFDVVYHAIQNALLDYHRSISPFSAIESEIKEEKNDANSINIASNEFVPTNYNYVETKAKIENIYEERPKIIKEEIVENIKPAFVSENIEIKDIVKEEEKPQYDTEIKYKYIGSVFDTYILIEIRDKLYIIDQHAAHERLLFERIKEMYYSKQKETQMLLIPSLIELKNNEKELAIRNFDLFIQAGFVLEEFGDNMIKISGIPNIGYDLDYSEMFKDILDSLTTDTKTTKEEKEFRFIATLACKAAVKGNMKLTEKEHISLIDEMVKLDRPFTCPHGRPTAWEISKYEIERRFSRK